MPDEPRGFGEVFNDILRYAKERGDLPAGVETFELAALLQAATMDALVRWAATEQDEQVLAAAQRRRAEVVIRGAAATWCHGSTQTLEQDYVGTRADPNAPVFAADTTVTEHKAPRTQH